MRKEITIIGAIIARRAELVESLGFKRPPGSVRMFTEERSQIGNVLGISGIAAAELG